MKSGRPAPRMGQYVQALRAIWPCEKAAPLDFKGEHFTFTLMTSAFSPPPTGLPMVPVTIAAVGPAMLRLASRHCDGSRLHAFYTRAYAEQAVVPEIEKGLFQSRRKRENFEISGGGFIVTGPDEASLEPSRERIRQLLDLFAAIGTFEELPGKVAARFGGISDSIGLEFLPQSNAAAVRALVEELRAIPSRFTAFSDKWANAPT